SVSSREALMETISRRYFQGVCDAIRKADPDHLILGIRWAGSAPDSVLRANSVFDVFSINIYRFEPPREQIERIYSLVKKPVLIGEFHFGAAERGYAPSLVMVKDQVERGAAYQYYVEHAAALPMMIGAHYFQLIDQPVTGRFDGENYNLGLLNQLDLPYPEMVSAVKATSRRIYRVHAGSLPPTDRAARVR
ncbi:MAG: glycoside hydrolase family 5 protein, partial [Acidobacteria bacterium]|nr:glycoside hydrolase family 5 protein [Acidobacteriota bacterium]